MTSSLRLPFVLALIFLLPHYYVYSYCIYNKMSDNTELFAMQIVGQAMYANTRSRRFQHRNIKSGTSECCPYSSKDCSKGGDRNNLVKFVFSYIKDQGKTPGETFYPIIPAGGYIVARGTFDRFTYEMFDSDRNRIQ